MEVQNSIKPAGRTGQVKVASRRLRHAGKAGALGCLSTMLVLLVGCSAGPNASRINPDRDVGAHTRVPLTPKSLRALKRFATIRIDATVPLSPSEAERRLVVGANVCWSKEKYVDNYALGAAGPLWKTHIMATVDVEDWPEIPARAIGLGSFTKGPIADRQGGYIVLFQVIPHGESESLVQTYQRRDVQSYDDLVSSSAKWLAGNTDACDLKSVYWTE